MLGGVATRTSASGWVVAALVACGPTVDDAAWDAADFAYLEPIEEAGASLPLVASLRLGSSRTGISSPVDLPHAISSAEIAWSPDGEAIAYAHGGDLQPHAADEPELWRATPSGPALVAELALHHWSTLYANEITWSPAGTDVLVRVTAYEPVGSIGIGSHLAHVPLEGLIDGPLDEIWPAGWNASWSPDGTSFVATRIDTTYDEEFDPIAETTDVYLRRLDDTKATWPPVNTDAQERGASWSPTGDAIAYVTDANGTDAIYVWQVSADAPRPIATAPCRGTYVEWFADASRLLLHCFSGEPVGFAVVDATTGAVVIAEAGGAGSPSPDGRTLPVLRDPEAGLTLHLLDLESGEATEVGPGWGLVWRPVPS